MSTVVRLETTADVQNGADPRDLSVSARTEAVLADGRRLLLLDGRGWTESLRGPEADELDVWALTTERDIAATARVVVGPDEPYGGRTQAEMTRSHWEFLAEQLGAQGVAGTGSELMLLPHDVVLGDHLRARLISST